MIELLCTTGIENAFRDLGITARMTYKRPPIPDHGPYHGEAYEVWEVSEAAHEYLCAIEEKDWHDDWGSWRSARDSNRTGDQMYPFIINGCRVWGWRGHWKQKLSSVVLKEPCYKDLLEYFCEEIGASNQSNVCALAVDMAKANDMDMAELFERLQP